MCEHLMRCIMLCGQKKCLNKNLKKKKKKKTPPVIILASFNHLTVI